MGLTISSIGCRDLRLARLLGCVVAESDAQVFDRQLSSDPRNGFRSRRRANGPSRSTALFPRCDLRRTINGGDKDRELPVDPRFSLFTSILRSCAIAQLRNMLMHEKRSKDLLPIAIGRIDHTNRSRPCLFAFSADCCRIIATFPSTKQRNGFRSRRRGNGPSKSSALFPRCKLLRTINGRR